MPKHYVVKTHFISNFLPMIEEALRVLGIEHYLLTDGQIVGRARVPLPGGFSNSSC